MLLVQIRRAILARVAIFAMFSATSMAQTLVWHQTNGPYGGNISALAANDSVIFAGLTYGGLYCSADKGNFWLPADSGLPRNVSITALAASGSLVFAGCDSGIYRSTDNGVSWIRTDTAPNVGPEGGIISIACNGSLVSMVSGSIYCSTDSGQTWALSLNQDIVGPVRIVGSVILAGTYLDTPFDYGIWRSIDSGKSWNQADDGIMHSGLVTGFASSGAYVYTTGIGSGTYASGGLYRSKDTGNSWSVIDTDDFFPGPDEVVALGSIILVDVKNDHAVYRSVDSGHSWQKVNRLQNPGALEFQTKGPVIYAGTEGGIFRSIDSGAIWVEVDSGIIASDVDAFAVDSSGVYAGAYGGGVYQFNTSFGSWSRVGGALVNSYVLSLARANRSLYAGMDEGALSVGCMFKNDLDSMLWDSISDLSCQSSPDVIFSLAADGQKMFAGDVCGIESSTDSGETWNLVDSTGEALSVFADSSEVLASGSQGVRESVDSGKTWSSQQLIFGYESVHSGVTIHNGQFFAAFGTIFRSTNSGVSWVELDSGLGRGAGEVIASGGSSLFTGGRSYSGPEFGVYVSTDNGNYWTQENTGLNDLQIESLIVHGTELFAGTLSGGVYETDISSLSSSVTSLPQNKAIKCIFSPNPDRGESAFHIDLHESQDISIVVVDPLGRVVWQTQRFLSAGDNHIGFDGAGLQDGYYFYHLSFGENNCAGSIIVTH